MATSYPPGGTFFDTLRKNFTDVPVDEGKDNAIPTTEFLEAAESLVTLFGMSIFPMLSCVQLPKTPSLSFFHCCF
jgi:hypothetical protein